MALNACSSMPSLLLQKPFHHSKEKNNLARLERLLTSWRRGDIAGLLREGHLLQASLEKSLWKNKNVLEGKLACTFSNLMFQGKTSAAIHMLTTRCKGGVLKAGDKVDLGDQGAKSVVDILRSKHLTASPTPGQALVFG